MLPHGINKKLKCETKNKLMGVIGPVQSHYHEGSPVGKLLDVCLLSICCITFDVL